MMHANNATLTRRELLVRLCKLLLQEQLEAKIDRMPLEMRPKDQQSLRCCVHKDRAVLKYKLMALLGYNVDDEEDELTSLREYAMGAYHREKTTPVVMTVVDEACSSCQQGSYHVSNMCQGCEARPCAVNCPKEAITFINGQAHIDHDLCVNCGKCLKQCPFHAIIYRPVPCEEACPVGAISKDDKGIERIDYDKCIFCGKCMVACPYGAIMEKSHIMEIFRAWQHDKKVVALVAPAIAAQFRQPLDKIYSAIRKVGFDEIVEVAEGAEHTIAHESAEWQERMEEGHKVMTTSCCHAYTELVKKHIPELQEKVSDTPSPMVYAGKIARERYPEAVTVFISPCTSKRHEAVFVDDVDYTLSFEELGALFIAHEVEVGEVEGEMPEVHACSLAQHFARTGGVTEAIRDKAGDALHDEVINGIDKAAIRQLKQIAKGKSTANFVEVMSCEGGCIGGVNTLMGGRQAEKAFRDNQVEIKEPSV